jgi:outer membrane protein TolC
MKSIKNTILLACLTFPFLIHAQNTYTLKQCLEMGLDKNYEIQIIRNQQQILENDASAGNAGYLPTLDLSSSYSGTLNNLLEQRMLSGETVDYNNTLNQSFNAGINLNWTIFDGLGISMNYKRLKQLQEQGELNTRLTIENFISNFTADYYNYIGQTIRQKSLQYSVKLSEERLRIVDASYTIGSSSRLDLQQAKVDLNSDKSLLIKQDEVIYLLQMQLNELMGNENIEKLLIIADSIIDINSSLNKDELYQQMLNNNTLLQIYKQGETLAKIDLKSQRSENYPYLRLNAGYGYTYNTYQTSSFDRQKNLGLNYGVTLGYTIFDGMNRKRKQQNAKIELMNSELEYQQAEIGVKVDFANAWMAYQNNLRLIELEENNLETAKDNYDIAIERYKLGQLSGIELREAQNSLLNAEERLVEAKYNTKLCEISLLQMSGGAGKYLE